MIGMGFHREWFRWIQSRYDRRPFYLGLRIRVSLSYLQIMNEYVTLSGLDLFRLVGSLRGGKTDKRK